MNYAVIVRDLDGRLAYYPMPEEICQYEAERWKSFGYDVLGIATEMII